MQHYVIHRNNVASMWADINNIITSMFSPCRHILSHTYVRTSCKSLTLWHPMAVVRGRPRAIGGTDMHRLCDALTRSLAWALFYPLLGCCQICGLNWAEAGAKLRGQMIDTKLVPFSVPFSVLSMLSLWIRTDSFGQCLLVYAAGLCNAHAER